MGREKNYLIVGSLFFSPPLSLPLCIWTTPSHSPPLFLPLSSLSFHACLFFLLAICNSSSPHFFSLPFTLNCQPRSHRCSSVLLVESHRGRPGCRFACDWGGMFTTRGVGGKPTGPAPSWRCASVKEEILVPIWLLCLVLHWSWTHRRRGCD